MPEQCNSDADLLAMEWPDAERDESLAEYNARTGRDLTEEEHERLRCLTGASDGN